MPLISGLLTRSYVATSLNVGSIYQYKVRSRNAFGFSEFSEPVSILAAEVPNKPDAPTTTFDRTVVKVDWIEPFDQGSPITGYRILVRKSDGVSYAEDLTDCNRLALPTVTCTIPVITLKTTPFEIPWGDHIWAKVIAINAYGNSLTSDAGNGAEIITYPDSPIQLAEDFSQRTYNSVTLTWQAGPEDGGSTVISY